MAMVPCAGCGGGIWPETDTFPLCQYCAAKANEPVDESVTAHDGNEPDSTPEAVAVKRPPRARAGDKSGKAKT